jgi:hypothetical protein
MPKICPREWLSIGPNDRAGSPIIDIRVSSFDVRSFDVRSFDVRSSTIKSTVNVIFSLSFPSSESVFFITSQLFDVSRVSVVRF